MPASVHSLDDILPARELVPFGLRHALVMAASPITAAFLVSRALDLPTSVTVDLISATLLVCGLGTLLQCRRPFGVGAKLPFIMVPGGAPTMILVTIARQTDLPTATGAAILRPGPFDRFPPMAWIIFGNGLAMGTLSAVVLKVVFHRPGRQRSDDALPFAAEPEGARHAE